MAKKITSVADLKPDPNNLNKGTERGLGMLDYSLDSFGAWRSIGADKNGVVGVGNKTLDRWVERGGKIAVVETAGDTLVVVQRTDLDMGTPKGKLAAIADNRVAQVDLEWDAEALAEFASSEDGVSDYFFDGEVQKLLKASGQPETVATDPDTTCPKCGHQFKRE